MLRGKPEHLQDIANGMSVVLTGSDPAQGSLPSDFHFEVGVRFPSGGKNIAARKITYNPNEFHQFDSTNFLLTPQTNEPIVLINAGLLYVKPDFTSALLEYVYYHPTITALVDTQWSSLADKVLIELIAAKYYEYQANSAEPEIWIGLQQQALNNARELAYGIPSQRNPE
jgi:hypothetical protein